MSENAPKISVIVPMYNAEKYLHLCISSILEQTFKDFELILIDDCSTDKTLEVAKTFNDSRIKILQNKKNLGMPGAVRNVGIDAARGEYLFFCDNDDVILPNGLEIIFKAAKQNDYDVVNTTKFYSSNDFKSTEDMEVKLTEFAPAMPVSKDLKTRIYEEFLFNRMHIAPWLFLYKRKFLLENKIKFPKEVGEDVFFNFDVVCATSKILKISEPFYIWRDHSTSTTHNAKRIIKNIKSIFVLSDHIEEKLSDLNDRNFVRKVLQYWISHFMSSYILPFLQGGGYEMEEEILKTLEPRFGKNASFFFTLLQLYLQGRMAMQENQVLKNKLKNIREITRF